MLISEKQQQANRENAQHSTGPTTDDGKTAVRFNALKYGLRARSAVLPTENLGEYLHLWELLENEWQPQTQTERMLLEQMCTSQWMLARAASVEKQLYMAEIETRQRFDLLLMAARYRASHERSFEKALRLLRQLVKDRQAKPKPEPQTQTQPKPQPPAPSPQPREQSEPYVMSEPGEAPPLYCAPAATDTR